MVLTIENGGVVGIEGGEEAKVLNESLDWATMKAKYPWGIRRLGEIGIGINPGAKMTAATIVSEKALGTAHVGIGSNAWFGGSVYAITHFDQVFKNPKIYFDGKVMKI